jgi:hypothetical protein
MPLLHLVGYLNTYVENDARNHEPKEFCFQLTACFLGKFLNVIIVVTFSDPFPTSGPFTLLNKQAPPLTMCVIVESYTSNELSVTRNVWASCHYCVSS